ncbi:MAG TPA: V-type ATPase 116kDa subunit family protein [Spirochaetota bacterium]|nr:V-type ATPase 116kDa subunit family protein [Spirochaetota bacterium]HQB60163.1 V-type ATPase 116kDa subunit family protein [Spirochaetota bacterium]
MKFVRLVLLQRDFQRALDYLGSFGWVEIKRAQKEKVEKFSSIHTIVSEIEDNASYINNFFEIESSKENGELIDINTIDAYFRNLKEIAAPYKEKLDELAKRKKEFDDGLRELEKFKNLPISRNVLESFEHIHFVVGSLPREEMDFLKEKLSNRIISIDLEEDLYIIFTAKKGRWTLESELKKLAFKERAIPGEESAIPKEIIDIYVKEKSIIEAEIEKLNNIKSELYKKSKNSIRKHSASFNLQKIYLDVYENVSHSESVTMIEGWVLKRKLKELVANLNGLFGETYSIAVYSPSELEDVKNGTLKVPVFMENLKFIKPFEGIVFNYGTPLYGTIDPTIFVTFSFLLFFGMMYGDIGQGFVIFLIGLFVRYVIKKKDVGFVLSAVGFTAMIFGYLYGSVFCFEHLSVFRYINKTLFGLDRAYIIDLSPANSLNIFYVTVGFGVIINLLGILINVINSFIKKDMLENFFSPKGVAGFFLLLSVGIIAFNFFVLGKGTGLVVVGLLIFSLILIFLKEPLVNIIGRKKPIFHKGFGMWIFLSIVEIFEVGLSVISNNLSFIRVGAFAFAHAILSFTVIKLATIAGGGSVSSFGGVIVLIVGNAVVIALEGMIVGIQSIRLEYYEFFSKFFSEQGKQFVPFKINKTKLEENS